MRTKTPRKVCGRARRRRRACVRRGEHALQPALAACGLAGNGAASVPRPHRLLGREMRPEMQVCLFTNTTKRDAAKESSLKHPPISSPPPDPPDEYCAVAMTAASSGSAVTHMLALARVCTCGNQRKLDAASVQRAHRVHVVRLGTSARPMRPTSGLPHRTQMPSHADAGTMFAPCWFHPGSALRISRHTSRCPVHSARRRRQGCRLLCYLWRLIAPIIPRCKPLARIPHAAVPARHAGGSPFQHGVER